MLPHLILITILWSGERFRVMTAIIQLVDGRVKARIEVYLKSNAAALATKLCSLCI